MTRTAASQQEAVKLFRLFSCLFLYTEIFKHGVSVCNMLTGELSSALSYVLWKGNLVDVIDAVWTVMAAGCLTCSLCLHHRRAAVFSWCSGRSALTWSTCVEELCYLCWWWCLFFTSWVSLSPPSSFYSVALWTSLPPLFSVFMVPGTIRKAQNLLKQYSQHGLDGKKGGSNLTPLEGNAPPLLFSFRSLTVQTCCHSSTCHNSFNPHSHVKNTNTMKQILINKYG